MIPAASRPEELEWMGQQQDRELEPHNQVSYLRLGGVMKSALGRFLSLQNKIFLSFLLEFLHHFVGESCNLNTRHTKKYDQRGKILSFNNTKRCFDKVFWNFICWGRGVCCCFICLESSYLLGMFYGSIKSTEQCSTFFYDTVKMQLVKEVTLMVTNICRTKPENI